MTDDLRQCLDELYPDLRPVPLASAIMPTAGIPAGRFQEVVSLAMMLAAPHFGGLPLSPPAGAPQAQEAHAALWSNGVLPGGLGLVLHGQTPETQDVLRLELTETGVLPLVGDVLVNDDVSPTQVLLRWNGTQATAVRLFGRGRELIVALHPDRRVEILDATAPTGHAVTPAIADDDGPALASLSAHPPPLARWLEGSASQPWLGDTCQELVASPWALDHLAAAGLIGRLWTPADPDIRRRTLLGTFTPPGHHALSWLSSLPAAGLDAAERAALREAERVDEALDAPGEVADRTLALAMRRDDLESVHGALSLVGRGTALRERLRALDTHGRACWSMHRVDLRVRENERLRCVHWSAPGSWWALFVEA